MLLTEIIYRMPVSHYRRLDSVFPVAFPANVRKIVV